MLLGHTLRQAGTCFIYGTLTHYGRPSQAIRLHTPTLARPQVEGHQRPHNTAHAKPTRLTHIRFRLIRVRSPLLTESLLFSLPAGTEMFHFPTFPPHTLYIQMRVTTHNMPRGYPIRTPSDHRSFTNSPRLIAGYHVLHRLLMPRHPPCALEHSHTTTHHKNGTQPCTSRITQETQQKQNHNRRNTTQRCFPRCSRPLSTYTTTPRHPHPPPATTGAACRARNQKNNHNPHGLPVCSPRTQQRVRPTNNKPQRPVTNRKSLRCSTHEQPPQTHTACTWQHDKSVLAP